MASGMPENVDQPAVTTGAALAAGVDAPPESSEAATMGTSTALPPANTADRVLHQSPFMATRSRSVPLRQSHITPNQTPGTNQVNLRVFRPQADGSSPQLVQFDRSSGRIRFNLEGRNQLNSDRRQQLAQHLNSAGTTISGNGTRSIPGNVNVRVVQLRPLVAEPVPENGANDTSHTSDAHDDEEFAIFKCDICYDFMNDPVGCPSQTCNSRFCFSCLEKVFKQAAKPTGRSATQLPKCPMCRTEFATIIRDGAFREEISRQGPRIPCRHNGCPKMDLSPLDVQDHEKECDYVQMKCRFASFGCKWTGIRGDIAEHEATDCALAKVEFLVDQVRRLQVDHSTRLDIVQQQTTGARHTLHHHRHAVLRAQFKSYTSLVDLFSYVLLVTTCTNRFFFSKDPWDNYYRFREGRGAVTNFLVILPTVLLCINMSLSSFRGFLTLCFEHELHGQTQQQGNHPHATDFLLEESLIGMFIGILAALFLFANCFDGKSSCNWGKLPLPGMGMAPLMCDLMAISIFMVYLLFLEFHGAQAKALLLWTLVAFVSTFFPSLVYTLSLAASQSVLAGASQLPVPDPVTQARSWEPVLFGLRYCVLATYMDIFPTIDAAILSVLFRKQLTRISPRLVLKNCFFENLQGTFIVAFFVAKAAMMALELQASTAVLALPLYWLVDSLLAFVILELTTLFLNHSALLGVVLGKRIIKLAEYAVRPQLVTRDYNIWGLVSFAVWVTIQGMLLQF